MSGKKFFQIDPENWPNQTTRERVVSERGRKELPPGTKGGENLNLTATTSTSSTPLTATARRC